MVVLTIVSDVRIGEAGSGDAAGVTANQALAMRPEA